jgi:predicted permease
LQRAFKVGALAQNPADLVDLPKQIKREVRAMSQGEAEQFLEAAREDRYYPLWCALLTGGLRPGEALGLRWQDVALGASSGRIGWEYLKESIPLGLLGGCLGLAMALAGLKGLLAVAPPNLPRMEEVGFNATAFLFTLILSTGTGIICGLLPVLRHRRSGTGETLRKGGRGGIGEKGRGRIQGVLAMSQIALAPVLLVAGGLMLRSFDTLWRVEPGFQDPEEVLTLSLHLPGWAAPSPEDRVQTFEAIVRRIEEVTGVSSVGLATQIQMGEGADGDPFFVREGTAVGEGPGDLKRHKWIGGGYFQALKIPLVMGRSITWEDVTTRARVALISENLAREAFGSPEAALGQHVAARPDPPIWSEVVGVVRDVLEDGLDRNPPQMVYWPLATPAFYTGMAPDQLFVPGWAGIAIRSSRAGTSGFLDEVQRAIWTVNPNLPLLQVGLLDRFMADSIAQTTFTLVLLGIAGGVALLLGLVGVYGVISYSVSQRRRELGMRIALGAKAGQVLGLVLRRGMVLSGAGLALGTGIALCVTRLMSSLLFGVSHADPLTFASVVTGLGIVALLATLLPARQATRVDPVVALRSE